ncbi:MAG: universal stress protein [Sphingomonadales bacterium]
MTDQVQKSPRDQAGRNGRKFLVIVDESPECGLALRFASRRAARTGGRVTLLYVLPPTDFQHWMAVGELMREEALLEADELLGRLVGEVTEVLGFEPEMVIKEGPTKDRILSLIASDPDIGVLVLGAGASPEGPGPLVNSFAGQLAGTLPIPVTVVPGNLTIERIDELT